MKIEVNVKKRYFFALLGILLVLGGVFAVYAYNSNPPNPRVFGHTINEVDGITCNSGQAVTRTAAGWSCVNIASSGGSTPVNPVNTLSYFEDFIDRGDTSEVNHPGIISFQGYAGKTFGYIHSKDMFAITFLVKGNGTLYGLSSYESFYVGLVDASVSSRIYFFISGGNWQAGTRNGGSTKVTNLNTGVSIGNSPEWFKLRIKRVDAGTIEFFINDASVGTINSNVPVMPMQIFAATPGEADGRLHVLIDYIDLKITNLAR